MNDKLTITFVLSTFSKQVQSNQGFLLLCKDMDADHGTLLFNTMFNGY